MAMPVRTFHAYWGAMTGWIRRIPASIAGPLVGTTVLTGAVLGAAVVVTLVLLEALSVFVGVFSAPVTGVLAFQPYAAISNGINDAEAKQARHDILSDRRNPLRCVSRVNMRSQARAVMSLPDGPGSARSVTPGVTADPIQVTDDTAALLPGIERAIATVPRGSEFFEAYAFVVTAENGGVDSWQRFVSVTTQMRLGTPRNQAAAMDVARVFFSPGSDLSATEGLSAAVMLRLTSSRVLAGEQDAAELLETAVGRCR